MESTIFRREAMDDVSGGNQFQDYIRTSHISLFVILAACILAAGALCVWGFFGQVPITLSETAICRGGELVFYVDAGQSDAIKPGSVVICQGQKYPVDELDSMPRASEEIRRQIGNDYLFTRLNVPDWSIEVSSSAPDTMGENETCEIKLLIDQQTPFELLFQ